MIRQSKNMMENKEQDKAKVAQTDGHPKPNDEVQLTIETVTPDTVRAVPETVVDSDVVDEKTEAANNNQEVGKTEQQADTSGQDKPTEAKPGNEDVTNVENLEEDDDSKEDSGEVEAEEVDENENAKNDQKEGDDERDQIETVAP